MDKLTPQLTEQQLKVNIDALQKQKVPNDKIQEYVNNYTRDTQGNFVLKGGSAVLPPEEPTMIQRLGEEPTGFMGGVKEVGKGIAKGVLSTAKGLGTIGQKLMDLVPGNVVGSDVYRPGTELEQKASEAFTPETGLEKAGFTGEQIAEFFIPAAKAAKAEKTIHLLSQGIKSPLIAAGIRVLGKAGVQAASAGGVSLAQTGGDVKEAGKVAATAGVLRGGMAVIGEGARAFHVPERLYSTIFKNSARDMKVELSSNGLKAFQQSNPERFKELVGKGVIRTGESGQLMLNDTLAEQALDKGLRGSIRNMANEVVEGTFNSEDKVRTIAQNYGGKVNLKEKQFESILREISDEYQNVGFNEISDDALRLADELKAGKGEVSGETALAVRRLLDRARIATSFEKPASKLSLTQQNLKTLGDAARKRINEIPGMGETMKDYSFYIDALDALAQEAKKRGNNQVLSLIDSLFLSGAFSGASSGGVGAPNIMALAARRYLMSAPGTTAIGQALQRGVASQATSGGLSGVASEILAPMSNP